MKDPVIKVKDVSRIITNVRKRLKKDRWTRDDWDWVDFTIQEVRRGLQLRRRGRKNRKEHIG